MSEPSVSERITLLSKYPSAVKELLLDAGDRVPDVLGQVHANQGRIRELKKRFSSELADGEHGDEYRVVIGHSGDRTYNTSSLLRKFMMAFDLSALNTLLRLMKADVVLLSWQWKKLEHFAQVEGISLKVKTKAIITDGDPTFDIGVVWKDSTPTFIGVDQETYQEEQRRLKKEHLGDS